jgi:hypothetical protein
MKNSQHGRSKRKCGSKILLINVKSFRKSMGNKRLQRRKGKKRERMKASCHVEKQNWNTAFPTCIDIFLMILTAIITTPTLTIITITKVTQRSMYCIGD